MPRKKNDSHVSHATAKDPRLCYRDCGDSIRVWHPSWSHDSFEVLDRRAFSQLESLCIALSIKLVNADENPEGWEFAG